MCLYYEGIYEGGKTGFSGVVSFVKDKEMGGADGFPEAMCFDFESFHNALIFN